MDIQNSAGICPLCGKPNHCAMANDKDPYNCWCTQVTIPDQLLQQIPVEKRNLACVCQTCVQKFKEQTKSNCF